jgi:hypothetical protein
MGGACTGTPQGSASHAQMVGYTWGRHWKGPRRAGLGATHVDREEAHCPYGLADCSCGSSSPAELPRVHLHLSPARLSHAQLYLQGALNGQSGDAGVPWG